MAQQNELAAFIDSLGGRFAPDRRVELFNIRFSQRNDTLILRGETTSRHAKEELLRQVHKKYGRVKDSIRLLPDDALGEYTWGVIYNAVGTMRAEPRYSGEIVSQALLGMPVRILERKGGWKRVQTPDRYIGWMNGSVKPMSHEELKKYGRQPKIMITALATLSVDRPVLSSEELSSLVPDETTAGFYPVSDLVAGNLLVVKGTENGFYRVEYPNGREAYVRISDARPVDDWLKAIDLTGERVVDMACRFTGIPYLWGGTSTKGLDCSGFTKMVYFMNGLILPRDASQQVHEGRLIDRKGDFDLLEPGDLLFFGERGDVDGVAKERVVHVAIYIGDKRFIHASDYIRISSFDPADPLYDDFNTNRYLRAKRILDEPLSNGIKSFSHNRFYLQ